MTTWELGSIFALRGVHSGVVSEFDEAAGIGSIRLVQGDVVDFHCTQIADGSRTILAGTNVNCSLFAANLGLIEAGEIVASLR
jgi:cold shock CspA family protein